MASAVHAVRARDPVSLQSLAGQGSLWDMLADQIDRSPPTWRWWIRRPSEREPRARCEYRRLVTLRRANIEIDAASAFPLPALLRHMSVVVSCYSGARRKRRRSGTCALPEC